MEENKPIEELRGKLAALQSQLNPDQQQTVALIDSKFTPEEHLFVGERKDDFLSFLQSNEAEAWIRLGYEEFKKYSDDLRSKS